MKIIEYIKEIYTLTCQVQSSSDAFIPGYEGIAEQPELPDYEFRIHLLLCEIWHRLYLHYVQIAQDTPHPQKHLQRLKDILSYLQEHASEELRLEDIAAHAGLCKSECCRFFKKYMRMTIFDYLLSTRIQNSIPLLMDGENITTIAGLVRIFLTGILWARFSSVTWACHPVGIKECRSHLPVTKRHLFTFCPLCQSILSQV